MSVTELTTYVELSDVHGAEVVVRKARTPHRPCVRLFVTDGTALLDAAMAARVRDALDAFVRDHGGPAPGTSFASSI